MGWGTLEYTVAHELRISHNDQLCIHPLFSGILNNSMRENHLVYSDRTELDDEDYRDRFE